MHHGLALGPVGTAAHVTLLGTRECLVGIVRVEILDLLGALAREGQFIHLVTIPGEFVDGHASVVFLVRAIGALARLRAGTRMFVRSDQAAVVIHGIPLALEFRKALVVVSARVMGIRHLPDSRNDRSYKRIGAHDVIGHAVVDHLRLRIEAQIIRATLLMDIGSFEGTRSIDALQGILIERNLAIVLGKLNDIQVVAIGALSVFATAENHIARTVIFDENARVEAVGNLVAAANHARSKGSCNVVHAMGFLDRIGIGAIDACRSNHAHTASAIRVNDVDSALMDGDAGCPGIVGVISKLAFRLENHAVIGPVLHIL